MELHVLHNHGWSISALPRELGLNRRTVREEVAAEGPRRYPSRAKPTARTESQLSHVQRRLGICPAIRGTDLFGKRPSRFGYLLIIVAIFVDIRHRSAPTFGESPQRQIGTGPSATRADGHESSQTGLAERRDLPR